MHRNLQKLTNDFLGGRFCVWFKLSVIGLLIFGRRDHKTYIKDYKDAYVLAFSPEKNGIAWEAVDAVPLTRRCLESEDVIKNSADDP